MISMTWPQYRRNQCSVNGVLFTLRPQIIEILSVLLMNKGRVVLHDDLIEGVWPDPDSQPLAARRHIFVQMSRLRNTLGKDIIQSVHSVGFIIP